MENAYKSHSVALNSPTTNKFNGIKLEAVKPPDAIHFEPITLRQESKKSRNDKNNTKQHFLQHIHVWGYYHVSLSQILFLH